MKAIIVSSILGSPVVRKGEVFPCKICNNLVTCSCKISEKHKPDCKFRKAAELSVELACDHGFQACPVCDACTCGAGEDKGVL